MWDERYAADDYVYGTAPNDFLVAEARRIPAGRVLAIGDGEGRNGVWLAQQGYDVTSVDQSSVGLAKAERLAQSLGVGITTVTDDLARFDIGDVRWQAVISVFCHLPSALRADVHKRIAQGLAPGGVFILEAYTPAQLALGTGGPKDADMLPSLTALRTELEGLELLVAVELEREVREGALHNGRSAVVQVVALKR